MHPLRLLLLMMPPLLLPLLERTLRLKLREAAAPEGARGVPV